MNNELEFELYGKILKLDFFDKDDNFRRKMKKTKKYHDSYTLDVIFRNKHLLKGGFLDIGSYVGTHTIFFSKVVGAKNVISFEPNKKSFKNLEHNIKLNDIKNVELYNVALSDSDGYGNLKIENKRKIMHNWGAYHIERDNNGEIPIKTLDFYNFDNISFIKIDAEGEELNILKGATKLLKSNPIKMMVIECEDDSYRKEIINYLNNFGFEFKMFHHLNGFWMKND